MVRFNQTKFESGVTNSNKNGVAVIILIAICTENYLKGLKYLEIVSQMFIEKRYKYTPNFLRLLAQALATSTIPIHSVLFCISIYRKFIIIMIIHFLIETLFINVLQQYFVYSTQFLLSL